MTLDLFFVQVKFLYGCVSYLSVALLHLGICQFGNFYYLHRSDFYVTLDLFLAQVKFLYAC